MIITEPQIYVVDDDDAVRESLTWFLSKTMKIPVSAYASGEDFLAAVQPTWRGCLVLDIRMPGMSGLDVLETLRRMRHPLKVIMLSGHADVPVAVSAMRNGAMDFVEKPYSTKEFQQKVSAALATIPTTNLKTQQQQASLDDLSPRQRDILDLLVAGKANKVIADELAINIKTVETHRLRLMQKVGAKSLAELIALAVRDRQK